MAFLDSDLVALFKNGKGSDQLFPIDRIPSGLAGRGVLIVEENRYTKIQISKGTDSSGGFRVTDGWREKGVFENGRVTPESRCIIAPGRQPEYLDMTFGYDAGRAYFLVTTFEPDLFRYRRVQESSNWL